MLIDSLIHCGLTYVRTYVHIFSFLSITQRQSFEIQNTGIILYVSVRFRTTTFLEKAVNETSFFKWKFLFLRKLSSNAIGFLPDAVFTSLTDLVEL